jgi:hypothetical protein
MRALFVFFVILLLYLHSAGAADKLKRKMVKKPGQIDRFSGTVAVLTDPCTQALWRLAKRAALSQKLSRMT